MIHGLGKDTKSEFKFKDINSNTIQPNAFDIEIQRVFRYETNTFELNADDTKKQRKQVEIFPDRDGYFYLNSGVYSVISDTECKISSEEAGFIVPRSSLNRNGVFLKSGLYDSGYDNVVGCTMYIQDPCFFKVQKGARIGQFLLFKAETLSLYNGSYNRK